MKRVALNVYEQNGSFYALVRHNKHLHHSQAFKELADAINWRDEFRASYKKVSQGSHMKERITTNIAYFQRRRLELKEELNTCQRCDKDLTNANRYEWCVHHIDHDRTNNADENFELLCKSCHQEEHHTRDAKGRFTK